MEKKNRKADIQNILSKLSLDQFKSNIIFVDNRCMDSSSLDDIWLKIQNLKEEQSQWNIEIPAKFIEMEKDMRRANVNPVINFKSLLRQSSNAELFVKYMKKSGFVLTQKDSQFTSNDDIISDPQWLINHFRKIVKPTKHEDQENSNESENWKISENKLRKILGPHHNVLTQFMEYLGLIAKPRMENEQSNYFIPSLMEYMNEQNFNAWLDPSIRNVSKTLVLDFRINSRQIPFPHFDKLMAEVIANPPYGHLTAVARNGCIVLMDNSPLGYFLCHGSSVIKITMFTQSLDEQIEQRQNECTNILSKIIRVSKRIGQRFNQYLRENPILGMSCNPFPSKTKYGYLIIKDVIANRKNCCGPLCKLVRIQDLYELTGNGSCIM